MDTIEGSNKLKRLFKKGTMHICDIPHKYRYSLLSAVAVGLKSKVQSLDYKTN